MTTTMTDTRKGTKLTQAERHEAVMAEFLPTFGKAVAKVANRHNWTAENRKLADVMVKSLATGDGSTPAGISNLVAKTVRSRFASTCIRHKVQAGSMIPGTNMEWFPAVLEKETEHYKAWRASQNTQHAQATAA